MSRALARRVAKLEDRRRAPAFVPHVADIREGETMEDAASRFRLRYGRAITKPRHAVLIVPTWPTFDAFTVTLKAQQNALRDWVREHHPKEPAQC